MPHFFQFLNSLLWGWGTISLLFLVGAAFTIGTYFLPITKFKTILKKTIASLFVKQPSNTVTPFAAMAAALGGTMGVGNIVGVAIALQTGGAGAVFWMCLGAFFGMMTKYAEVLLAIVYRNKTQKGCRGGPMYYMEKGLKGKTGRFFAIVFSSACVLGSFGTGNMVQTNAISTAMKDAFDIPICATGFVVVAITAVVILGGSKRILRVSSGIVPLMAGLYLVGAGTILWIFRAELPRAIGTIFSEAFSFEAASGGFVGLITSKALRIGISRGISTNEAGLGSAPIAHACSETKSPVEQGMWGIVEVFVDTILVCTVTALAILVTGVPLNSSATTQAFTLVWGDLGNKILATAVSCFAIASVFSWCMYGAQAMEYLFPNKPSFIQFYNKLYLVGCFVGCVTHLETVWQASDVLNALMLLPNIVALLLLYPKVIKETNSYFKNQKTRGFGVAAPKGEEIRCSSIH